MTSRTRTHIVTHSGSRQIGTGSEHRYETRNNVKDTCDDVVGFFNSDNPLLIRKERTNGSLLSGATGTSRTRTLYVDEPSFHSVVRREPPWQILFESEASSMLRGLALTNPSRPDYLAPAFIAEMRDIPRMVKYGAELAKHINDLLYNRRRRGADRWSKSGDISPEYIIQELRPTVGNALSKAKQLAMANLTLQFGVAPLVNDIASAFLWPESVDKRLEEIKRLHQGSGLKRRVDLVDDKTEWVWRDIALSSSPNLWVDFPVKQKVHRWMVVTYRPTTFTPPVSRLTQGMNSELRNMMSGLTLSAIGSSAWELLPWSWLADYFGSVGDFVASGNNHLQTRRSGTLMTHTTNEWSHGQYSWTYSSGKVVLSSGSFSEEYKKRIPIPMGILPDFGIPFLGGRQLSILGSITATRAFR